MTKVFKVGDRVVGIGTVDHQRIEGFKGTVKDIVGHRYSVEFDVPRSGFHSCGGTTKPKHGWNVDPDKLRLLDITTDDRSVNGYIVCLAEKGRLYPATSPVIHTSLSIAEAEASRLAATKGGAFIVLKTVTKVEGKITKTAL